MKALRRLSPHLLAILLLSIPFHRVLYYSDRVLLFRDLTRDLLPQKSLWAASIRAGHGIPLWNHFALGGSPSYSMLVGSPLNPLNFVFLLFPQNETAKALGYYLWLHYLLFYFGFYLLLRSLKCSREISLLMAVGFSLSGYMLSAHSLGHLLASSVSVPWFFFFLRKFFSRDRFVYLAGMSASLAWPVYGGDPQFSYLLALSSLFFFLREKKIPSWLALVLLALLASSAQLLPAAADILRSQRLGIEPREILYFSFHPIRLLELFFPLFFGNRYGGGEYWGHDFVNFSYKNPFIFCIYPGILTLLALFFTVGFIRHWRKRKRKEPLWLCLVILAGFIWAFGDFFPLPLYEWTSRLIPLFGLFRYPERLLFWPLFAMGILAALILEKAWRARRFFRLKTWFAPGAFLGGSLTVYLLAESGFVTLHEAAVRAIFETLTTLGFFLALAGLMLRLKASRAVFMVLLILLSAWDLWRHQSKLIWDQNIHITDGARYKLINRIRDDLKLREEDISHGAAFRLGAERFPKFQFVTQTMDHTSSTSFSAFENLIPNTAGLFGIEDIAGYFSFTRRDRMDFWDTAIRLDPNGVPDFRFYFDLMGAYYIPDRDPDQQIVFKVNTSVQPYLFVPERVFPGKSASESLERIQDPVFRSNRDLSVYTGAALTSPAASYFEQIGERGNFKISRRSPKAIEFDYLPANSAAEKYLTLNEGFDENWKAFANGTSIPVYKANGWAMALKLPAVQAGRTVHIDVRYENPYILLGALLSGLWCLAVLGLALLRPCIPGLPWESR